MEPKPEIPSESSLWYNFEQGWGWQNLFPSAFLSPSICSQPVVSHTTTRDHGRRRHDGSVCCSTKNTAVIGVISFTGPAGEQRTQAFHNAYTRSQPTPAKSSRYTQPRITHTYTCLAMHACMRCKHRQSPLKKTRELASKTRKHYDTKHHGHMQTGPKKQKIHNPQSPHQQARRHRQLS